MDGEFGAERDEERGMSALRKAGVWLGLVEDDDDRGYDDRGLPRQRLPRARP